MMKYFLSTFKRTNTLFPIIILFSFALSDCTKKPSNEPTPSPSCDLKISPENGIIDGVSPAGLREQIFTLTGNNANTAAWESSTPTCATIDSVASGSSIRVVALSDDKCTTTITAKTNSPACIAQATLTVYPPPADDCDLNIEPPEPKTIGAQGNQSYTANGNITKKNPVNWTIIPPQDNISCVSTPKPQTGLTTTIQGQNTQASSCHVTVQASISNTCTRHVDLSVEAPPAQGCKLKTIEPSNPPAIDDNTQQTFNALDNENKTINVDWSLNFDNDPLCNQSKIIGPTNAAQATVEGHNSSDTTNCSMSIIAKENASCTQTVTLGVNPQKPKPSGTVTINADRYILSAAINQTPDCNATPSSTACLPITVINDNSQPASLSWPNFNPADSVLHAIDSTKAPCNLKQSNIRALKSKGSTNRLTGSLAENKSCTFYVFVQSDRAQSTKSTELSISYSYENSAAKKATLPKQIEYSIIGEQVCDSASLTINPQNLIMTPGRQDFTAQGADANQNIQWTSADSTCFKLGPNVGSSIYGDGLKAPCNTTLQVETQKKDKSKCIAIATISVINPTCDYSNTKICNYKDFKADCTSPINIPSATTVQLVLQGGSGIENNQWSAEPKSCVSFNPDGGSSTTLKGTNPDRKNDCETTIFAKSSISDTCQISRKITIQKQTACDGLSLKTDQNITTISATGTGKISIVDSTGKPPSIAPTAVTWSSDSTNCATLNNTNGLIATVAGKNMQQQKCTANITASINASGYDGTCTITTPISVRKPFCNLSLTPLDGVIESSTGTTTISGTLVGDHTNEMKWAWVSSNPNCINLPTDTSGNSITITGKNTSTTECQAIVTAKAAYNSGTFEPYSCSATATFIVKPTVNLCSIYPRNMTIDSGSMVLLEAFGANADQASWTSDNTTCVTVPTTNKSRVTAKAVEAKQGETGTCKANITATYNGGSSNSNCSPTTTLTVNKKSGCVFASPKTLPQEPLSSEQCNASTKTGTSPTGWKLSCLTGNSVESQKNSQKCCYNRDLSNLDAGTEPNSTHTELSGSRFDASVLNLVNFDYVNMQNSSFINTLFNSCKEGDNSCTLKNSAQPKSFKHANFNGSNFKGAQFGVVPAELSQKDQYFMQFEDVVLDNSSFYDAKFELAHFENMTLNNVLFTGNAVFINPCRQNQASRLGPVFMNVSMSNVIFGNGTQSLSYPPKSDICSEDSIRLTYLPMQILGTNSNPAEKPPTLKNVEFRYKEIDGLTIKSMEANPSISINGLKISTNILDHLNIDGIILRSDIVVSGLTLNDVIKVTNSQLNNIKFNGYKLIFKSPVQFGEGNVFNSASANIECLMDCIGSLCQQVCG